MPSNKDEKHVEKKDLKGSCHCGQVNWHFHNQLASSKACNCTVCRRYGVLWAYGYLDEDIRVFGTTQSYTRGPKDIEFHFCPNCGCVAYWLASHANKENRYRVAVNLRLVEDPASIASVSIVHFDGLDQFKNLPTDGKCIQDLWF